MKDKAQKLIEWAMIEERNLELLDKMLRTNEQDSFEYFIEKSFFLFWQEEFLKIIDDHDWSYLDYLDLIEETIYLSNSLDNPEISELILKIKNRSHHQELRNIYSKIIATPKDELMIHSCQVQLLSFAYNQDLYKLMLEKVKERKLKEPQYSELENWILFNNAIVYPNLFIEYDSSYKSLSEELLDSGLHINTIMEVNREHLLIIGKRAIDNLFRNNHKDYHYWLIQLEALLELILNEFINDLYEYFNNKTLIKENEYFINQVNNIFINHQINSIQRKKTL